MLICTPFLSIEAWPLFVQGPSNEGEVKMVNGTISLTNKQYVPSGRRAAATLCPLLRSPESGPLLYATPFSMNGPSGDDSLTAWMASDPCQPPFNPNEAAQRLPSR